ncbi:hypothetical protein SKAU_G00324010 [Synaphobranchus kaupii]|uniref:Uncharacterized protein n=1 Tax=Synaphobranchus kaupii TaxID=118154 RepID=A0A9Q1EP94_SYNKA|nr:hypothetical protein SKAU_G00324010 [Synaphobranchus kaupii]
MEDACMFARGVCATAAQIKRGPSMHWGWRAGCGAHRLTVAGSFFVQCCSIHLISRKPRVGAGEINSSRGPPADVRDPPSVLRLRTGGRLTAERLQGNLVVAPRPLREVCETLAAPPRSTWASASVPLFTSSDHVVMGLDPL